MSAGGSLRGRHVLVTGASGFIGAHLVARLERDGAVVHAVSRSAEGSAGSRWWRVDLADAEQVAALVAAVEPMVIFHLASEVAGAREVANVLPMFRSNLASTVNLLCAAAPLGARVVLAGSMEEPDPGDPGAAAGSPYAAAKGAGTIYARMFHTLYGLPVVHLRVFMVYGPGQRDERKLVPYVTLALLRGEPPRLMSGRRAVDWIYVEDVVDAFLAAAVSDDAVGRSLDVGTGRLETVRGVVERLAGLVGGDAEPEFGAMGDRPLEAVRIARTAATEAAMGWKPRVALEVGLARTVAFYRDRPAG